ncbi:hypothetical protein [Salipaludibacillus agaradhaerens]|jgi:hypothetical protein|nr:hypothetical protein [Salipaludibacillus agaradhaerens]
MSSRPSKEALSHLIQFMMETSAPRIIEAKRKEREENTQKTGTG